MVGRSCWNFLKGKQSFTTAAGWGDPERVAQTVQTALLGRGKNRIDLLVLSHADADHFNGTLDLIRAVGIRQVAFARSFLKVEFQGFENCSRGLAEAGIPVRLLRVRGSPACRNVSGTHDAASS